MPPIAPVPSHNSHSWWESTPMAPSTSPPHQQAAATSPVLRGPERSAQPPQSAAEEPRKMKNRMGITCRSATCQSQVLVNRRPISPTSAAHLTGAVIPSALVRGKVNTEKPYAIPMHRWIASVQGGTSQRLNPGRAIVRSRARNPGPVSTSVVDMWLPLQPDDAAEHTG